MNTAGGVTVALRFTARARARTVKHRMIYEERRHPSDKRVTPTRRLTRRGRRTDDTQHTLMFNVHALERRASLEPPVCCRPRAVCSDALARDLTVTFHRFSLLPLAHIQHRLAPNRAGRTRALPPRPARTQETGRRAARTRAARPAFRIITSDLPQSTTPTLVHASSGTRKQGRASRPARRDSPSRPDRLSPRGGRVALASTQEVARRCRLRRRLLHRRLRRRPRLHPAATRAVEGRPPWARPHRLPPPPAEEERRAAQRAAPAALPVPPEPPAPPEPHAPPAPSAPPAPAAPPVPLAPAAPAEPPEADARHGKSRQPPA